MTTATILQFISPVFISLYNRIIYQVSFDVMFSCFDFVMLGCSDGLLGKKEIPWSLELSATTPSGPLEQVSCSGSRGHV